MSGFISAQDETVPIHKFQINGLFKNEVGPSALGTTGLGGVQFTSYLTKNLAVEAGFGVFGAGGKLLLYPSQIERGKVKFYFGIGGAYNYADPINYTSVTWTAYAPIGATWFTNSRWNFSADVGPAMFGFDVPDGIIVDKTPLHFSVKAGYRFTMVRFKNRDKQIDVDSIPDPN